APRVGAGGRGWWGGSHARLASTLRGSVSVVAAVSRTSRFQIAAMASLSEGAAGRIPTAEARGRRPREATLRARSASRQGGRGGAGVVSGERGEVQTMR